MNLKKINFRNNLFHFKIKKVDCLDKNKFNAIIEFMGVTETLTSVTLNDTEAERLQLWTQYKKSKKKFLNLMRKKNLLDLWQKRNQALVTYNSYKKTENLNKVNLAQQNLRSAYRKVMSDDLKTVAYTFFKDRDNFVQLYEKNPSSKYAQSVAEMQNYFRLCF